jgi:FAD:protein FMN transferase
MSTFKLETKQILENTHWFTHKAMATEFEIFILHDDFNYSQQAAREAFTELDRLELELSRFLENSDISRINNLKKDQSTKVGIDTFECLQQCRKIFYETNGAFDITIGNLWKTWLNSDKTLRNPTMDEINSAKENTGMTFIELDETHYTVKLLRSPIQIDLGGFGKGYALDKMAGIFRDWEVEQVLLHGGRSSVLGLNSPLGFEGWPITLSDPFSKKVIKQLYLNNHAISGSGLQKGQHIIDPRRGEPIRVRKAAWAVANTAALCDALSTAFIVMSKSEIDDYCKMNNGVQYYSI